MRCRCIKNYGGSKFPVWHEFTKGMLYEYSVKSKLGVKYYGDVDVVIGYCLVDNYNGLKWFSSDFDEYFIDISVERDRKIEEVLR